MDDPELLGMLEPGQRKAPGRPRLPRRKLSRGTLILLVALRVYVVVAIPIVGYAFFHALALGH